jgi:DNA-binding transcriptional LysR family regulator
VLVRLEVQILPTDRAEPCAVGLAEDLLGQLERDRVACPGAQIEVVVDHVIGSPLVSGPGLGVVELAHGNANLDLRVSETAHAGTREPSDEREPEDRPARDIGGLELDGNGLWYWPVALSPEHERLEIDVEAVPPHLPRPESESSEIEGGHVRSVTRAQGLTPDSGRLATPLLVFDSIMEADRWLGLDLRHLVALKTISDEGSFGRAADRLGYTQSAISQQIATLERAVGLRLIERPGGPRPISLTEAGEILLRHAEAIEARLQAARADMEALRAGEAGRLRVGTFQSVGARVLPALLRRFSEAYPRVQISLQESVDEEDLVQMVERGELDVTFITLPVTAGPYDTVELLSDPYVLVVPVGSPLAATTRTPSLKEIALQPLVGFSRCRAMDAVESQLTSSGRTPNVVFRSDNNGTVQGLVGAGVGISVAPLLTVDEDDPSVVVIDLAGRIAPRVIGLVWHRDRHRSSAAEAFVETAIAVCREVSAAPAAA